MLSPARAVELNAETESAPDPLADCEDCEADELAAIATAPAPLTLSAACVLADTAAIEPEPVPEADWAA